MCSAANHLLLLSYQLPITSYLPTDLLPMLLQQKWHMREAKGQHNLALITLHVYKCYCPSSVRLAKLSELVSTS